jgi:hypothetical protein
MTDNPTYPPDKVTREMVKHGIIRNRIIWIGDRMITVPPTLLINHLDDDKKEPKDDRTV